jgi:hypothetical protein
MKLWWLDVLDVLDERGDAGGDAHDGAASDAGGDAHDGAGGSARGARSPAFDEVRALVAMACVDGAPDERERACVAAFVGVDVDVIWRVYRPREAGVPAGALAARRVLQRMAEVALSDRNDGVLDDSERALLSTYARAWGVMDDELGRLVAGVQAARTGGIGARARAALGALTTRLAARRGRRSPTSPSSSSSAFASGVGRVREVR